MTRWFQLIVIPVLALLLISIWNFWLVVRPARITSPGTPASFGMEAEDVTIVATDGVELKGWYLPAPEEAESESALIILHGYPADKANMLPIAEQLHPYMSLLLLDMRYFGESGGRATTLGIKEPEDVRGAVNFLREKGYDEIGVFGFSFGGAVALMAAAKEPAITAVGSYAAFADLRQLGNEVYFILPGIKYPIIELMNLWSGVFFGEFALSKSPYKAARNINVPAFIVHSKQDEQISFKHAEKIKESLAHNNEAKFYFLEEGRHGVLPEEFYSRLIDFFK